MSQALRKLRLRSNLLFLSAKYLTHVKFIWREVSSANDKEVHSFATAACDDLHLKCASYVDAAAASPSIYAASDINNAVATAAPASVAAPCTPTLRPFTLLLKTPLAEHEHVGLTGDSKALGEWQLERAIKLNAQSALEWRANVMLHSCRHIKYRYFIYVEDAAGHKQIRRWETHFTPRQLGPCPMNCQQFDQFGVVSSTSGEVQIHRGWLTHDAVIQFKFEREKMFQVHDIEKLDPEHVQLKLVPTTTTSETKGIHVEVSKHKYNESHLQEQPAYGVPYTRNDVIIFHITLPATSVHEQKFRLECYNTGTEQLLGSTIIDGATLTGSEGVLELNVEDATPEAAGIIALLRLPYMLVKPYDSDLEQHTLDFRSTNAHYWPKSWPNLDVGHRGNGKSYIAEPPAERENTIASFMSAYTHYADMIELDVHLTADGVPVIYHDFGLLTARQGKEITSRSQLEYVLIKDVRYERLKNLRVFAVIKDKIFEYPSHNAETRPEHRIFPRLVEVLQQLPKSLGIDVEIKWPQRRACGGVEAEQTIDKNFFADRVLQIVITYGCGRPLIFSSFDADMCTMLRFKQNIFPVMFLTMGETKKWEPFTDLRTRNFIAAINNAQAFELAGTAPHAEDFVEAPRGAELMQMSRAVGQIAVVWGDDCNSKERVKYFTKIGATATCYDRSDLYMPEHKERAFFNSTTLLAEFEAQCRN